MQTPDNEELFARWLEGTLDQESRNQFEKKCQEDEVFSQRVETAKTMDILSRDAHEYDVPKWNPCRDVVFESTPPWWQWQWLPVASLVTSCLAIFIVVMRVEFTLESGAMTLSFPEHRERNSAESLSVRLDTFQREQTAMIMAELEVLRTQQAKRNEELVNYLVGIGRTERQEDFNHLVKYINELRRDDQLFYAKQMMSVHEALRTQDSRLLSVASAAYMTDFNPSDVNP